ncbi:MAG: diphthamide biosynthesis enzyme Dph2 [Methanoregulaceae archaeon]|nr:diphthamide biosynthesis enzyme Dph2 [Methanoregulaceae archaeon]
MTDISDLVTRLCEREAASVALQFPAGLKRKAAEIADALSGQGFAVIISGDPCYGACDLSLELLAYADVLVHFGHTPLIAHPDVLHVPWRVDFNPSVVRAALPLLHEKAIGVITTAQHTHMLPGIVDVLRSEGFEPVFLNAGGRTPEPGQVLGCSFEAARIPGISEVLFVGTGVFHPLGVQLATGAHVVALDPLTGKASEVDAGKFLRKRHALIEKARSARHIGIIVSTKPGQNRFTLARYLLSLCDRAYLVFMNEVSPDELLNLGFEAYVNTACPRLAYDDQIRFPVPVLTPGEFEILCGTRRWEEYRADEIL